MKILFVGSSPSKRNFDSNITVYGTQSFKTLLNWIDKANLDYFDCVFVNACAAVDTKEPTESDITLLRETVRKQPWGTKVVAVGKVAAWALRLAGITNYLELPHPLSVSKQLGSEEIINKKVEELRDFCYRL